MKEKIYHICKKIFVLPAWLTVLIAVPSVLALILFFLIGKNVETLELLEVPIYCLSAYALIIVCTGAGRIVILFRKWLNQISIWIKFREDPHFRTIITVLPSLLLNGLYVATNIAMGVKNHAMWFAYLGGYYLVLVVMKFYLLKNLVMNRKGADGKKEWRKYRNCGIGLLLLNMVLNAMCVYIVQKNQDYHYAGMLIYVMAAVAFYSLIAAVINLIKFRKYESPVLSAVKIINLTTAMVTMLALETAMISQFGETDQAEFRHIMTSLTSGAVCLIEFLTAIYMIYNGNKNLKDKAIQ